MPKDSQNIFLPLLPPAMPNPKPKARKPKTRKTFWSENSHEINRIGAKGRYASSDSNNAEDDSSSSGQEANNSQGTSNTESETDVAKCHGNYCFCRDILKRPLASYEPGTDGKIPVFEEFRRWLDGGFHSCSATASSSAFTSAPIDSGNDDEIPKCDGNYCFCRDILKRPHDTYGPGSDLKIQVIVEFRNGWMEGFIVAHQLPPLLPHSLLLIAVMTITTRRFSTRIITASTKTTTKMTTTKTRTSIKTKSHSPNKKEMTTTTLSVEIITGQKFIGLAIEKLLGRMIVTAMQSHFLNSKEMTTIKLSIYMVTGMRSTGLATDKSLTLETTISAMDKKTVIPTLQKKKPDSKLWS
jgi:hypothetical protein